MHLDPEHGALRELATLAPLGVLGPDDRRAIARHLRSGCVACTETIEASRHALAELLCAAEPVAPSPALRARVLGTARAAAADPRPLTTTRRRRAQALRSRSAWRSLAAAAAIALLAWQGGAELEGTRREAERERLLSLLETVGATSTRAVALDPSERFSRAQARGFLEPGSRRIVLFVHDLPPAPPSQTYQLWTLAGERPSAAGTFATTGDGAARHAALAAVAVDEATRLAVTLEPAGGSDAPAGPIVLAER